MENYAVEMKCVIGYCVNSVVSYVGYGIGRAFGELVKFFMVLGLTYLMGYGIFYMWEHNLSDSQTSRRRSSSVNRRSFSDSSKYENSGSNANGSGNSCSPQFVTSPSKLIGSNINVNPGTSDSANKAYPFVVDLPEKISGDSMKTSKKGKT